MTRHVLEANYDPLSGRVEITAQETIAAHPGDEKYAELTQDLWSVFDRQNNIPGAQT